MAPIGASVSGLKTGRAHGRTANVHHTIFLQVAGLVGEVGVDPAELVTAPPGRPLHPGLLDSGAADVFSLAPVQTPLLSFQAILLARTEPWISCLSGSDPHKKLSAFPTLYS